MRRRRLGFVAIVVCRSGGRSGSGREVRTKSATVAPCRYREILTPCIIEMMDGVVECTSGYNSERCSVGLDTQPIFTILDIWSLASSTTKSSFLEINTTGASPEKPLIPHPVSQSYTLAITAAGGSANPGCSLLGKFTPRRSTPSDRHPFLRSARGSDWIRVVSLNLIWH
jgi:hypothetical protein